MHTIAKESPRRGGGSGARRDTGIHSTACLSRNNAARTRAKRRAGGKGVPSLMADHLRTRDLSNVLSTRNELEFRRLIKKYRGRPTVIAEGDSWFAYPPKWIIGGRPSNVIAHLKRMKRFNLLHLSSNGDEAVGMLTGDSKLRLIELIDRHHVHFLLFSGGGNDLVGRYDFEFFLNDGESATTFMDCINEERFDRRLGQIESVYRDLIGFCDDYSTNKKVRIVTHCYDYLIPGPQGAEFLGGLLKLDGAKSWMHPYLMNKNVDARFHRDIARHMIDQLAEIFSRLQEERPDRFVFANTRNILDPNKDWLNEIHPTPKGFKKIAAKIFAEMSKHFSKS